MLSLPLLVLGTPAQSAVDLTQPSYEHLGQQLHYLFEPVGKSFSLSDAMAAHQDGQFLRSDASILHLGIAPPAHWVSLDLNNSSTITLTRTLELGPIWLNRADVYLIHEQQVLQAVTAGSAEPSYQKAVAGQGFLVELSVPPGPSALYIRLHNNGTHPLMLRLLDDSQRQLISTWVHYSQGGLYGYLLALIAFNVMLYSGLRDRNSLNYSLFLASFILLNLTYTGHSNSWLGTDSFYLLRYGIALFMISMVWTGLHFARHFLDLKSHYPTLDRSLSWMTNSIVLCVVLLCIAQEPILVQYVTFPALGTFPLIMVLLGLLMLSKGLLAARYFLAAAAFGMLGTATTNLAVWGVLPFTPLTFHAIEIGILIEATLLALALAYQMRQHQVARLQAEHMARTDPLTGLLNRRAFFEFSDSLWSTALRNRRPLSVIMLDIDNFKEINDQHSHATGDLVLIALSSLLQDMARHGDLSVRWGGEEFLLLLPETSAQQAQQLAERLRRAVERLKPAGLEISASFGVCQKDQHAHLDSLINAADQQLYAAKAAGRNCVFCANGQNATALP
nr:diguanylate cyclase [Atopomonas sediminilitoris]